MAVCPIQGHPEMYGLGIRIAFYIHWLGEVLITHLSNSDIKIPIIQASSLLFSVSISISLIIQCANDALEPAEIYILLLLASGMYFPLIPVYLIRMLSCCHPKWNARSWVGKGTTALWIKLGLFIEAIVVAGIAIWFWTTFIASWEPPNCSEYGFFFAAVDIDNVPFTVFNILIYAGFILVCVVLGLDYMGCLGRNWRRARRKYRKRDNSTTQLWWKRSYLLSSAAISSVNIAGIELSILYNNIPDVHHILTAAQLYPMIIGVLGLGLFLYQQYAQRNKDPS